MTNYSLVKTANSAKGSLAGGISANQGTLSLLGGEGGRFPTLGTNEYFYITVTSQALATNTEIMRVTARSADTLTIKQADGSARNLNNTFSAGDSVEIRTTSNSINDLFDLDNILPDPPTQPDKFKFRNTTGTHAKVFRTNPAAAGEILSAVSSNKEDQDVKFAIKSDGTNADYIALAPDDISEDNNTDTGIIAIPTRGHPYLSHVRNATETLTYTSSTQSSAAATYSTQTSSDDSSLYSHAEDHDIPVSVGSLVYLANVAENDSEHAAFGEWMTANSTNAVSNSTTVVLDTVRRTININGSGSYTTVLTATAPQWVGKYLVPVATKAGAVNIPPGTHVVSCTITDYGLSTYSVSLTLNNNVTIPQNNRIQFIESRTTQLGGEMSASQPDTVYYKRNVVAPALSTINGEANIKNAAKDAYMPVSGRTANMYLATFGQMGTAQGFTSTQYYMQQDTNETNGTHNKLSVKCKPLSVNSVFSIRVYCAAAYQNSSYAGIAVLCDFLDNDPQPNNSRMFKNPNDNSVAKNVVLVGHYMMNDRFKRPELNDANAGSAGSANFDLNGFSTGRITSGTWPNNDSSTGPGGVASESQQPFSQAPDYYSGNMDGNDLNGADDNDYLTMKFHNAVHFHGSMSSVQFFRPGVTDFIRFRVFVLREDNSGTTYFPYPDYGQAMIQVEEFVQPEGCFGVDIPGGLDTTASWNGNLV